MKGQDNGIEIEVASDAPSNFIGTVEEDPSIALSAGGDSDDGTNLSSYSDSRSPPNPKKMFIKTALAATLVAVVTFSIGYVSGIRIRNATNNTNEASVSSAKNLAALQDVTGSAVGSKSSKDSKSKSAKDDLIKELLARVEELAGKVEEQADKVEALEKEQEALKDGTQACADKVEALEKEQEALKDGQEDLQACVAYDSTARECTIGKDAQVVAIEPSDNITLSTAQNIKLNTTTGDLVADIADNIALLFGQRTSNNARAYLGTGDLSSGSSIRVAKNSGNIELISNTGDIKVIANSTGGSFLTDVGKNIDMIFGKASTANSRIYIGTGPTNDLKIGNSIRISKGGNQENIQILSNPGRVFILSGTGGNSNKKGYLTGTCENYNSNRKDVCQG